jgi:hypothetical protein
MAMVYKLGEGYAMQDGKPFIRYPYGVDYAPARSLQPFILWEGGGNSGGGGFFSANEVLKWPDHLRTAGVEWLIPFLERIVAGEAVAEAEILGAYRKIHQKDPPGRDEKWA